MGVDIGPRCAIAHLDARADTHARDALGHAKDIAASMSSEDVEHCKMAAEALVEYEAQYP